jgi:hypothetical protein
MNKKNKIFFFSFLTAFFLLANSALAAGTATECNAPAYFSYIFNFGLGASGILAITMIVLGAIQMMLNAANPSAQNAGKDRIKSALMGLALIFGSWLILYTINPDLVDFCHFGNIISEPIHFPTGSDVVAGAPKFCVSYSYNNDSIICGPPCSKASDCPGTPPSGGVWTCIPTNSCH